MDLEQIHPALRVSGWRTPTLSGGIVRWVNIGLATFRVDCLAIRETELLPANYERLQSGEKKNVHPPVREDGPESR
jgi:hypothetical protein